MSHEKPYAWPDNISGAIYPGVPIEKVKVSVIEDSLTALPRSAILTFAFALKSDIRIFSILRSRWTMRRS